MIERYVELRDIHKPAREQSCRQVHVNICSIKSFSFNRGKKWRMFRLNIALWFPGTRPCEVKHTIAVSLQARPTVGDYNLCSGGGL